MAQASTRSLNSGDIRSPTAASTPVEGRPTFLLPVDLGIFLFNKMIGPREKVEASHPALTTVNLVRRPTLATESNSIPAPTCIPSAIAMNSLIRARLLSYEVQSVLSKADSERISVSAVSTVREIVHELSVAANALSTCSRWS